MQTSSTDQRRLLGAFLRTHRERLAPQAVGLPLGARRRTPGLRREEAALLSGVSATWYTWLEQGRDVSASPEALARLADSLQLTRAERAYLFELAGRRARRTAISHGNRALARRSAIWPRRARGCPDPTDLRRLWRPRRSLERSLRSLRRRR